MNMIWNEKHDFWELLTVFANELFKCHTTNKRKTVDCVRINGNAIREAHLVWTDGFSSWAVIVCWRVSTPPSSSPKHDVLRARHHTASWPSVRNTRTESVWCSPARPLKSETYSRTYYPKKHQIRHMSLRLVVSCVHKVMCLLKPKSTMEMMSIPETLNTLQKLC